MNVRSKILIAAYKLFPFSLKGDAQIDTINPVCDISCIINFYGRIHLLEGILYSLFEQDLTKERFEVILVEDKGGTEDGKLISKRFNTKLNIKYFTLSENYGRMGYSRNYGLSQAKGKYILFLDDDTVILQNNFLSILISEFETSGVDAIIPFGSPSFCLLKEKYDFHDPYYPTNRCMAYRRNVLKELGGFVSEIIGQEDVEFVIRYIASGKKFQNMPELEYYHPPLIANKIGKAAAVGASFARLRKRYPFFIWIMLLMNGLRYLPMAIFPITVKWRMQGRFSLGFVLGIMYAFFGKETGYK
jgi:glycosyltransferase involved in cell wall biosynthesis